MPLDMFKKNHAVCSKCRQTHVWHTGPENGVGHPCSFMGHQTITGTKTSLK